MTGETVPPEEAGLRQLVFVSTSWREWRTEQDPHLALERLIRALIAPAGGVPGRAWLADAAASADPPSRQAPTWEAPTRQASRREAPRREAPRREAPGTRASGTRASGGQAEGGLAGSGQAGAAWWRSGREAGDALSKIISALPKRDAAGLAGNDAALAGRDPALAGRDMALAGRDTALAGRDMALAGRDAADEPLPRSACSATPGERRRSSRPSRTGGPCRPAGPCSTRGSCATPAR